MVRKTGWALVLLGILGVVALGPFFAPYSPTASVARPYRSPGPGHLLGTDVVGRDVLSRLLHGGWSLVAISAISLISAYALGLALGLSAGLRPRADPWIMRPVDAIVIIPWFLVLAVTATALGPGAPAVLLTSALAAVPWIARIVRTAVHDIASTGYVESARARGEPLWRIAVVEILPNLRGLLLADAGVRLSGVISIVAVGGFLGLGLRPPAPDWALMVTENRPGFGTQPWSVLAPALLIMVLVVSVNMLSDRVLAPPRRRNATATPAPDAGEGLRTEQLTVRTDAGRLLLEDVSVRLAPGRGLAVIGPSGAGKTTFVSAMLGALPPGLWASGTATIGRSGRHQRSVGFVPQDPATGLNPALRIGTSIAEIIRASGVKGTGDEVTAALRRVGLPTDRAFRRRFPHELSGGQQQRVLLAMAMIGDPAVVVLDEPTTGLDRRARADLVGMLGAVRRDAATAFVIVTHDLPGITPLVEDVLELDAGRVMSYRPIHGSDSRAPAVTMRKPQLCDQEPILRVEALTVAYRSRTVVDGISFDLVPGSCLALTGVSGAGKTTMARAVTGLHPAAGGTIRLGGTVLPPRIDERTRPQRRAVQLIPQNPASALNPAHRVGAQIRRPLTLLRGMGSATAELEVTRLLTQVGLDPDLASRRPGELSGGQQQRVALARALAADPQVLICDEITASLDAKSQQTVIDLLDRLRRNGPALLVISHQSTVLDQLADVVLDLDDPDPTVREVNAHAAG
ncbi:ABC transporter ATP-binding protein/permease [Nocardia grenadensis]|uniref:ABC transporter ATP-binding protein/permease n=1 Tax=Nocardia grenadensis TaxID=931537 RepID=UPI000A68225A|nr:ATP-binding cassette domain-containing protein [Nocardia grenadensis]